MSVIRIRFTETSAVRNLLVSCGMHEGRPLLVRDHGLYLMFQPRLDDDPLVAYAEGCDPRRDDGWMDQSAILGHDDFVEVLAIPEDAIAKMAGLMADENTLLEIEFEHGATTPRMIRVFSRR